jgi:FkbM family methyltransferase
MTMETPVRPAAGDRKAAAAEARKLKVVGPYKGGSGYDRHTREFVREFVRRGVRVELNDLPGWSTPLPEHAHSIFDRLAAPVGAETVLHFTMPHHAKPEPGRRNVNYTMFEAERIPAPWVESAQAHDLIALPTEAALRAWADSGVPEEKLRVCPLGVGGEFFSEPAEPGDFAAPDGRPVASFRSRFLHIAELRRRKNHLGLLRAWMNATHRDDDAVLILKVSVFQQRVLSQFQEDVLEMQRRSGRSLLDAAPVVVLADHLADDMIRSLYASASHYVSLSHGEGWDLPMMEAAVSGLALIAPAHSAYLTYLREEEAYLIPASLGPARFDGKLTPEDAMLFHGLRWWHPDEDAAADVIRSIVRGSAPPKRSARDRIAAAYSWEKAAAALLAAIGELPAMSAGSRPCEVQDAPGATDRRADTTSVRRYDIRGIELVIGDAAGSIGATWVANETSLDEYGLARIDFHRGDIVIDIGAHVGIFAIYAARRHPDISILAFEPDPVNYSNLLANIAANGVANVIPHRLAITCDGRPFSLDTPPDNSAAAGGYHTRHDGHARSTVDSITLDEIFERYAVGRSKLLKIDCEGAEYEILTSTSVLDRVEWLSGEFHVNESLKERGCTVDRLMAVVGAHLAPERIVVKSNRIGE